MDTSDLTIAGVQPGNAVKSRLSVIVFILVFFGRHPRFNYRGCPDLNLRQISQSESDALVTHLFHRNFNPSVFNNYIFISVEGLTFPPEKQIELCGFNLTIQPTGGSLPPMQMLQDRLSSGPLPPLQMPSLSASWPPIGGMTSPGLMSPGKHDYVITARNEVGARLCFYRRL